MNDNGSFSITSADGTTIACSCQGTGPVLIKIDGALQHGVGDRSSLDYADLLASHFTAVAYDRRGRGASTDTLPYAIERELEDLEAIIDRLGGHAFVWGHSSGAALAMRASAELGGKIRKLVMYEPPYNDSQVARASWRTYRTQLDQAIRSGHPGEAVELFMRKVGLPDDRLADLARSPAWTHLTAVGATLGYDAAMMGDDAAVPGTLAERVPCPTLILTGGDSPAFFSDSAGALAAAIPEGDHRSLPGQGHAVSASALAPVLTEFFLGKQAGRPR